MQKNAIIAMLKTNVHDHVHYKLQLSEFQNLISALGYRVRKHIIQTKIKPSRAYLFGKGKIKEIAKEVEANAVEAVFVYNNLTTLQKYKLETSLNCEVLDRYEVTLNIFEKMASDTLSKLQITLARIRKLFPYYKLRASIKYKKERPGFMGRGEYAYHNTLSLLKSREAKIKQKIEKSWKEKIDKIRKAKEMGMPLICLIGYYNAGKTSLFNSITGVAKPVSDSPFTTLSSKYYYRYSNGRKMLFVDTIGFVMDLDPKLITSFKINLEDIRNADVHLLVVDVSDPLLLIREKIKTSLEILRKTGIKPNKTILVFNKIDKCNGEEIGVKVSEAKSFPAVIDYVTVSAKTKENIGKLLDKINKVLLTETN